MRRTGKRRDEGIRRGRKRDERGVRSERKNKRLFSFATAFVDLVYECCVGDGMCSGCTPNVRQGRRHSGRGGGGELGVIWGFGFHQGALNHFCSRSPVPLLALSNERDDLMTASEVLVITRWWNV